MSKDISIQQLMGILKLAWSRETSFTPEEWSEANRARGQCVVSALVINDHFGGHFRRYEVEFGETTEKHYANVLPDGVVIDVAGGQYPPGTKMMESPVDVGNFASIREKLLSDEGTLKRYNLLRQRVGELLG